MPCGSGASADRSAFTISSGASPLMPTRQVRACIHLTRELLHLVQRDGLEAGDGAERDMPIGRAAEDVRLQPLLAELLLVVRPQVLDQRVQLRILEPREVLVAEPWLEQLRQDDAP